MKVLFTGFDPFGGATINPAYEAIKLLPDTIAGAEIIKVEIPTVFRKGAEAMIAAVEEHKPDYVICVGQAGGRATVTPEFVGINYQDARIPDNEGRQPCGEIIKEDGATAYFTKLPVKAMVQNMRDAGIPASISYTAGTYVCNDVMYHLLYCIEKKWPNIIGGFIHVPYASSQVVNMAATTPSLSLQMISDSLRIAVETTLATKEDLAVAGGETH